MTLDEFRERLRATRGEGWILRTPEGIPAAKQIRRVMDRTCCPIDAVGGDWHLRDGGLELSLPDYLAILRAADDSLGCERALRAALLSDVGLTDG